MKCQTGPNQTASLWTGLQRATQRHASPYHHL